MSLSLIWVIGDFVLKIIVVKLKVYVGFRVIGLKILVIWEVISGEIGSGRVGLMVV